MKRIALAAAIIVCLAMLSSTFVLEQDYPPASSGFEMYPCMMCPPPFLYWYPCTICYPPCLCWPATPNEPVYSTAIPTPAPSPTGHVPVTIYMGKPSDLSFIYEGGKLAYVQYYSKDDDRVIRITHEKYRTLAGMGKLPYYGTFAQGDHGQAAHEADYRKGAQEKASGSSKYVASDRGIMTQLRDFTQSMINKVRTDVVPAVNSKIVTPLRDYTQSMINKVRTAVT